MGANRKRLANQMSGDGGEERTDKKDKSGRKKKDKKRGSKYKDGKAGKGKPSKGNKESSSSTGNSLEQTATAEGKQMAQVLSTFSRLEQSRFEAFRKAAFDGEAIAKYVAHCLIHEQHRPVSVGSGSLPLPAAAAAAAAAAAMDNSMRTKIPGANSGPKDRDGKEKARFRNLRPNTHYQRRLVLSELVAPGQAQDITVVVSTLAKEYAQRLVLAARRYSTERLANGENSNDEGGDPEDESAAISPEDLFKAHADRQARGLDPGFFLQKAQTKDARATETSLFLADPDSQQRYSLSRSVALAAQEEYDKEQQAEEETNEETGDGDETKAVTEDGDAMKMESTSDGDVDMVQSEKDAEQMDVDKEGNSEQSDENASDSEEEDEDPSEQAMRLFSLHVNRMIARQNGINIVTSDDEDNANTDKKDKEIKPPFTAPSSSLSSEGGEVAKTATEGKGEAKEAKPPTTEPLSSTPTETKKEDEGAKEEAKAPTTAPLSLEPNQQGEAKDTMDDDTKLASSSSSTPESDGGGKEATSATVDGASESKRIDEIVPMDTSSDTAMTKTTENAVEAKEATSSGDVEMAASPDKNAKQAQEQPQEGME